MKATVIQIKNGIMMNVRVSEKDSMIGVLLKMIICGILVCHCECNKACVINKYLNTKSYSWEKRPIG